MMESCFASASNGENSSPSSSSSSAIQQVLTPERSTISSSTNTSSNNSRNNNNNNSTTNSNNGHVVGPSGNVLVLNDIESTYTIKAITITPPPSQTQDNASCEMDFDILPRELKELFLRGLETETVLKIRSACRNWKNMVNELGLFDVTISEQLGFNGMCELPLGKCEITGLRKPRLRSFFLSRPPKEIVVRKGVSQWIISEMIRGWSEMTNLKLCWRPLASTYLFHYCHSPTPKKPVLLSKLHTLKLEITMAPDTSHSSYKNLKRNLDFIFSWQYPQLECLCIKFVFSPIKDNFLDLIFPFISRHASTLRTLELSLKYSLAPHQTLNFHQAILFEQIPWPTQRTTFNTYDDVKVSKWTLHCPFTDDQRLGYWKNIISNRHTLGHHISTRLLSPHLSRISHFDNTMSLYSVYLQRIDIINMSVYTFGSQITSEVADLSLLEKCVNLKFLSLRRAPIILLESKPNLIVEIVNVKRLPKSIKDLTFDGFYMDSKDMKEGFQKLCQLETFECSGNKPNFTKHNYANVGINEEAFISILTHENLLTVNIHFSPCIPSEYPKDRPKIHQLIRECKWEAVFDSPWDGWEGCRSVRLNRYKSMV